MRCEPDISICSPMSDQTIRSLQREEMEMVMSANLSAPTGVQRLAPDRIAARVIALQCSGASPSQWRRDTRVRKHARQGFRG
jgi:hypothetical protein